MFKTAVVWVARKGLEMWGIKVVREVVLDEMERLAKRTDNTIDDKIVRVTRAALLNDRNPKRFLE